MFRVTEVRYVRDYVVWVRFSDGVEGGVDLANELDGAVFERLRDRSFFFGISAYTERDDNIGPEAVVRTRFDREVRYALWPLTSAIDTAGMQCYDRYRPVSRHDSPQMDSRAQVPADRDVHSERRSRVEGDRSGRLAPTNHGVAGRALVG